jgi:hypothetical protein
MINHNNKGTLTVLGIDLAKLSFQLHGVDAHGQVVLNMLWSHIWSAPHCKIKLLVTAGGCFHISGLSIRLFKPLALMEFAPIRLIKSSASNEPETPAD